MKFTNIKNILRKQIENNVEAFWVFHQESMEFIQVHKEGGGKYPVYSPKQLLYFLNAYTA
tara:strand:+ start:213 stop:392 length:180 start_codon:yes stop_codon:yes gene_type:complete